MDGACALYEAWVKMQIGDADVALVYGFGQAVDGRPAEVTLALQLDPVLRDAALARRDLDRRAAGAALLLESGLVKRDARWPSARCATGATRVESPRPARRATSSGAKLLREP